VFAEAWNRHNQQYTERLSDTGHHVVPHLAARMIETESQAAELAQSVRDLRLDEVFIIAGDAPEPHGPYSGSLAFMRDFLAGQPGVSKVGIAGYPDGHPSIPSKTVRQELHSKQALLAEHGIGGWVSSQMCFDPKAVRMWLLAERRCGLALPVRLGLPGVVDRARLLKLGTRLGIGASIRFVSKNTSTVTKLMAPGGFDPTSLVTALADDAPKLGIDALHCFTFNCVAETRKWQETIVGVNSAA
jgi:methylenetetrahydrofolate reductase (NADPH)